MPENLNHFLIKLKITFNFVHCGLENFNGRSTFGRIVLVVTKREVFQE